MTRRTLLGALAVLPVPMAGVERVRYRPQAGDVITGPNGTRVEVTEVLTQTLSDGSHIEMVYYTKTVPCMDMSECTVARMEQWQHMDDWHKARLA